VADAVSLPHVAYVMAYVINPAAGCRCFSPGAWLPPSLRAPVSFDQTKLYCLLTEVHCVNNLPRVINEVSLSGMAQSRAPEWSGFGARCRYETSQIFVDINQ